MMFHKNVKQMKKKMKTSDFEETVQQNEAGANEEEEKEDGEMTVSQEPEADVQQNKAGANEEDEDVMEEEAKKIFYWGKVATM